ncbi:MAG: GDP-mannose 4,6-dehydratase, partial [Candidatus Staskawiczbacteria bacterium]|nr:GDP-mannose 4,6-dehydratase [Candidatus Staskawiczbacteria bacterium]
MKILITGVTGFVGSHLAEYCLAIPGTEVYGTTFSTHLGDELRRIEHIKDKIELFECNLTNRVAVARVLEKVKPDKIFHLAAQSFVLQSWKSPEDTIVNNIISELNIFEVVRELKIDPVIHIAGSSEEYGLVYENELPIKEDNPLRPLSPYAVSKAAQDNLACQYYHSYGLKTVITRGFNHEGPRRGEQFVTSDFAKQIVEIEKRK